MRVLIVDKSETWRIGLRLLLREGFEDAVFREASNTAEALEALVDSNVDLLFLSTKEYRSVRGRALIELQTCMQITPLILLGNPYEWGSVNKLIDDNVSGFLPKNVDKQVAFAAINLVLAGGKYCPPEFYSASIERITHSTSGMQTSTRHLTRRQLDVLKGIALGKSNKSIALELGITSATVKDHITKLMSALKANNRTHAMLIASQLGILDSQ